MSRKQTAEDKIAKVLDSYHAYLKEWKYDEKSPSFLLAGGFSRARTTPPTK